jgi:hypothetical protein
MRRIFDERSRLVVYLEQADLIRMTAKARESGQTLVEWARESLRNELAIGTETPNHQTEEVPRTRATRMGERGPAEPKRRTEDQGLVACKHGAAKGLCKHEECNR